MVRDRPPNAELRAIPVGNRPAGSNASPECEPKPWNCFVYAMAARHLLKLSLDRREAG